MKRYKVIVFLLALFGIAFTMNAITLNEAKEMYLNGQYEEALPVFEEALASKPKDASLNHWVGVCLYQVGRSEEAIPYLEFAESKKVIESPRYLAEIAFYDYRFADASECMKRYEAALEKAERSIGNEAKDLGNRIEKAQAMLDRVEKIVIIDSVAVDKNDFFEAYKLSVESGSLNSIEVLPEGVGVADPTVVYMPETRSSMVWASVDSLENFVLVEAGKLLDNSWERPRRLGENLGEGGDSNFPFMMSDGVTLYFANTGENSIGGYDIFISRRDENGFLQPQNIGMPYNSPYDDYMMAIDEFAGVGWWATDRNHLDDMVTIYKFIPSDMRNNYSVDEPNLVEYAKITNYKSTWKDGDDYAWLLEDIDNLAIAKEKSKDDFRIAMPGGRIYTKWDDFSSGDARDLMKKYIESIDAFNDKLNTLEKLRYDYRDSNPQAAELILKLEKQIEEDRVILSRLKNQVIGLECL